MLQAGYKTTTHLDNSDKPDTKIVNFKHLESFRSVKYPLISLQNGQNARPK